MGEKVRASDPAHHLQKLYKAPVGIRSFTASARLLSEGKKVKLYNQASWLIPL